MLRLILKPKNVWKVAEVRFYHLLNNNDKRTFCRIYYDGEEYVGEARCSKKDQFNKKFGRDISFLRATEGFSAEDRVTLLEQYFFFGLYPDYAKAYNELFKHEHFIN